MAKLSRKVILGFLLTATAANAFASKIRFRGKSTTRMSLHFSRLPMWVPAPTTTSFGALGNGTDVAWRFSSSLGVFGVDAVPSPNPFLGNFHEERPAEQAETTRDITDNDFFKARMLLIGAAALYGTNFSLVKLLGTQTDLPIGVSSALRFGMAALALFPFLLQPGNVVVKEDEMKPQLGAALLGLEVGVWNSIGYVAQAVGLQTTDASKSAFICSLAVVTVPILDFFTGKRLLPREFTGASMALAGVAALELGGLTEFTLSSGDVASLIQPLAFGIGFWKMEKAMQQYPTEALRTTAGQLLAVFLGSLAYCLMSGDASALSWDQVQSWLTNPSILFALLWTGVVTTALTVYMETLALKTLSAAETTLIFSTEPLWGTAFAAAVVGEQLGVGSAIGAVLILSGCVYSNLGWPGIVSLVTGKKFETEATSTEAIDPTSMSGNLLRVGLAAMNELNMGACVVGLQAMEFLEDIFPALSG